MRKAMQSLHAIVVLHRSQPKLELELEMRHLNPLLAGEKVLYNLIRLTLFLAT